MASPFKHSTLSNFYSIIQFEDLNWTCILFWLVHFLLFLFWVLSFVVYDFQLRCFRLFVLGFPLLRHLLCCYTERPRAGGRTRAFFHARAFQTLAPPTRSAQSRTFCYSSVSIAHTICQVPVSLHYDSPFGRSRFKKPFFHREKAFTHCCYEKILVYLDTWWSDAVLDNKVVL